MGANIHTSHRMILFLAAGLYLVLVLLCAVWPAVLQMRQDGEVPVPVHDALVARGRELYRSYNCVTCHTQQIRGDGRLAREEDGRRIVPVLAADARFGREEASTAQEYAHESPPLLGTQRTGPDLSTVGKRLPEAQWHYWHLFRPRSVSPDSIMPPHRFLFTTTRPRPDQEADYERVNRIEGLGVDGRELWATPDARALVEYLLSLTRERVDEGAGG